MPCKVFEMLIKKKGFALDDLVTGKKRKFVFFIVKTTVLEIYDKMIQYPLPISTTCILYPHLAEVQYVVTEMMKHVEKNDLLIRYRLCRGADDFVEVCKKKDEYLLNDLSGDGYHCFIHENTM
jgi:hypothetical protein